MNIVSNMNFSQIEVFKEVYKKVYEKSHMPDLDEIIEQIVSGELLSFLIHDNGRSRGLCLVYEHNAFYYLYNIGFIPGFVNKAGMTIALRDVSKLLKDKPLVAALPREGERFDNNASRIVNKEIYKMSGFSSSGLELRYSEITFDVLTNSCLFDEEKFKDFFISHYEGELQEERLDLYQIFSCNDKEVVTSGISERKVFSI
ncbi:hypothetical protein [Nissabacter sp. SGAir0207]|uniref:hypothetical protein n=1 Tax=Nissabacter sp. SGAir0207 TaxID=2126321 RepID=UPI0010CD5A1D|nr:hypothetical protein [Nissabacter sp. SGAir0207]QCR38633.1 hypothetical protein C1N62_21040 [Nissabacter sp. SGAir0207]